MAIGTDYTLKVTLKEQTRDVHLSEVPKISWKTMGIFHEMGVRIPTAAAFPISNNTATLLDTVEHLQEARSVDVKNKILSFVHAAFLTAVVAAGVIGAIFTSAVSLPMAFGIAAAAAFIYGLMAYIIVHRMEYQSKNIMVLFGALLGAPFLPIFEAFRRVSCIESDIVRQENNITLKLVELNDFFSQDHSQLIADLKQRIDGYATDCDISERAFPIRIPAVKNYLLLLRNSNESALQELLYGIDYFKQFQPEGGSN